MKSTVGLIGDDAAIIMSHKQEEERWITSWIRDNCQILPPNSKIEVLGTIIGSPKSRDDYFE